MKQLRIVFILVVVLAVSGCPGPFGAGDEQNDGGPDVYLAGFYLDGTTPVAAYWLDNEDGIVRTPLPSTDDSEATDIYVTEDGTVYTAGYDGSNAVYWVDSQKIPLGSSGQATGIQVVGSTVYVSGYITVGTENVAIYWKDDTTTITPVALENTSPPVPSTASDIQVDSAGVVYVSGDFSGGDEPVASYWIDDAGSVTRVPLYEAAYSQAFALALDGDVFVAGLYDSGGAVPAYWQQDSGGLQSLEGAFGSAQAIARAGDVTYVAGDYLRGDFVRQAAYWQGQNTTPVDLVSTLGETPTYAYGVAVAGGSIFVAGIHIVGQQEAVYWKDGTIVPLSAGVGSGGNAIFVVN